MTTPHDPFFFMEVQRWLREKEAENRARNNPMILTTDEFLDLAQADLEALPPQGEPGGDEPEFTRAEAAERERSSHTHN